MVVLPFVVMPNLQARTPGATRSSSNKRMQCVANADFVTQATQFGVFDGDRRPDDADKDLLGAEVC